MLSNIDIVKSGLAFLTVILLWSGCEFLILTDSVSLVFHKHKDTSHLKVK